ncbi:4-amino-4-deoxy-L-arabinose transferase-like glycosyltransferase [Friedmanniella endophytica]|uniref:4-amino-4-deoxy-L-arabinose transferase-like glycosyltransferase n=1 Tax=Microlunatus kandeliicorticis TaxID=1759536 RepID=A0A7W3IS23_9ACTN|nr:glycosyltransferase family 39 protein [Microlunatus kandeliicorticis]MBA8794207.1 4-amino-4-deoxy-L-arabinose transferase-like glycosyltransferase [Microlunatus kandeliicorticis]
MVRTTGRPPLAPAPVASAVLALGLVLALTAGRYGYHRDELYFRLLPLRWGYVDQPPLLPALTRAAIAVLGDEVASLRLPALLLACGGVVVIALLARELGGGPFAQGLAAWGHAFGSFTLSLGHLLLTSTVDLVVWPAILLAVVRVVARDQPRWWLLAGALVGLDTWNKWLIVMLVLGVLLGLLAVGPRRVLRTRWLALGAGLAVLLALPNVVWQLTHGLPQLGMAAALSGDNGAGVRVSVGPLLLVMIGPFLCWVWVLAVVRVIRRPELARLRFVVATFVVVLALTVAGGSQVYYPYPALAAVYALGCVQVERLVRRRRPYVIACVGLTVASGVVLNLPVLPLGVLRYTPVPSVNQSVRDQIGWPRYVDQIDRVAEAARRQDPAAVIVASNYGEAGALDRYGVSGLPVYSPQNALWELGRPAAGVRTVVLVGGLAERDRGEFASCRTVARLDDGVGVDTEEQAEPVALCTGPTRPWDVLWPAWRRLS